MPKCYENWMVKLEAKPYFWSFLGGTLPHL